MVSVDADLESTAYHEAGHAVAYLVHRRRFRYVTIRARQQRGRVVVRPRAIDPLVMAVIAYAGPLAQARHTLSSTATAELWEMGITAADVITAAFLDGGDEDLRRLGGWPEAVVEQLAGRLLDEQWGGVEALAAALLLRRTIPFAEADEIFSAAAKGRALG